MPHLSRLAHEAPVMQAIIILQWHTWVQETFDVNIKIAQTKQNFWIFICRKVKPTEEMAKFGDYLGDFILCQSGGPKSGVFQIIRESWQHWSWDSSHEKTWNIPVQKQCVLVLKPMSEALLGTVLMLEQSQSNRLTKYLTWKKNCSCSAAVMFNYAGSTVPQSDGWWCSNPSE